MPKYLIQSTYTVEGAKAVMNEGGSSREEAVAQAVTALGGSLEACYFAFGDIDAFMIVDLPDNVTAAAASLVGNAVGTHKTTFTVLITPKELDQAADLAKEKMAAYRPPGA